MTIRGILFDNDGTLVDTHDIILSSMRYTMQTVLGRTMPDDVLMAKVGIPLADQMEEFAENDGQCDELLRVYRAHNERYHDGAVALFPGVLDGLKQLHEHGLRLGVVTSKRHELAQRGLEITGAWPYLECLVGSEDCETSKPQPGPILAGARLLELDARECIYLGDAPFDIQAGNAAGATSVAALWGMFDEAVLEAQHPAHRFPTFAAFTAAVIGGRLEESAD